MKASVYIGTSLDGFIARTNGDIDWMDGVDSEELGKAYEEFMSRVDAIVMGRGTYEKVLTFDVAWPWTVPVFVMSKTLAKLDDAVAGKATLLAMEPKEVMEHLSTQQLERLYIDGGKVIQSFLAEGLVDELIICTLPILIGSGIPLFGQLAKDVRFKHIRTNVLPKGLVMSYYERQ